MKSGPKPRATSLKLLQGETKKDRLNENEPKFDPTMPECPAYLKPDRIAMREWGRKSDALHRAGVLTEVDDAILADYCDAFAEKARLVRALRKFKPGTIEYKRISGSLQQVTLQKNRAMCELGITPSARTRIKALPKPKANKWEDVG